MPYIGRSENFGVRTVFHYLASNGDTSVSGADVDGKNLSFSDGNYIDVYLNGVRLKHKEDYVTTTANTVGSMSAMNANDEVNVVVYDKFGVADTVSASTGGTFAGAVTIEGDVSLDGGNFVFNESSADKDFRVESNANTHALFIEGSSSSVGIGTSSPSFETGNGLEVNVSGALGSHIKLTDSASGSGGTNGFDLYAYNTSGYIENYEAGAIVFRNGGTESARITADDFLGLGTSSPIAKLHLNTTSSGDNSSSILFSVGGTAESYVGVANDSGNIITGSASGDSVFRNDGGKILFSTDSGSSAKMRMEASGIVLVGGTTNNVGGSHLKIGDSGNDGEINLYADQDGGQLSVYDRTNSNYEQMLFNASQHRFDISNTQKMLLDSSGHLNISDGDLVIGTSGHGINFAATGDGAGTDTSELLDDYEEGTFTAVVKDDTAGNAATQSAQTGRYTKIGRVVNCSFAIQISSLSGMTAGNTVNVTGLPYTINNDSAGSAEPHAQILSFINNLDSADYAGSIIARPNNNTTAFELKYTAGGSVTSQGATSLLVQDIASNTFLAGSATYETT